MYSYKCCSIIRFSAIFLRYITHSRKWISPLHSPEKIIHSFEWMDFWLFFFLISTLLCDLSIIWQIFQGIQWWYPFSTMSYASQENSKKPNNWAAFVWIQKCAPRKIYFFTDFIKTHLCASLDGGIGKCHQSQTWRYQGATVSDYSTLVVPITLVKINDVTCVWKKNWLKAC